MFLTLLKWQKFGKIPDLLGYLDKKSKFGGIFGNWGRIFVMITDKFGTAINCMDGRVQVPVADWVKLHSGVQYVDMITEPGADKVLAERDGRLLNSIYEKLRISVELHQSEIVAVAGHFECAGNPVDFETHQEHIELGVELLQSWNLGVRIVGLYVNEWSAVDVLYDSNDGFEDIKSFL